MSGAKIAFLDAVKQSNWDSAFLYLNGLSMTEMLAALTQLTAPVLDLLIGKTQVCWATVNMPRIVFAAQVVKGHAIPAQIPAQPGHWRIPSPLTGLMGLMVTRLGG